MSYLVTIYKRKNFKVYDDPNGGYIIHNTNLNFKNHHTHINKFSTCKYIINLCITRTVPYYLSEYLLESILRLSNDTAYKYKIESKIIDMKSDKRLEKEKRRRSREGISNNFRNRNQKR